MISDGRPVVELFATAEFLLGEGDQAFDELFIKFASLAT